MTVQDIMPPASATAWRGFRLALILNLLWINASEIFRYFVFVMPMMRDAFPMVDGVAPMNLPVFLVWGAWDTVLVVAACVICWLVLDRFGPSLRNALIAGTLVWATAFVILWLGLFNMGLATGAVMAVALPLAWIEMAVAALIVGWAMRRRN
ncbi:hypothetical protein L2U69_17630 [Zavarzinia compransoris]|uniref:hypothetical protein n=1 Tax=Zavarzinia marina TaxID=2911065 RepID=UPI001F21CFAD|nr:hypothetical protein [Zavarzinia marina]MCF4167473.1 hypothetical protein [Zavarzinia marina]